MLPPGERDHKECDHLPLDGCLEWVSVVACSCGFVVFVVPEVFSLTHTIDGCRGDYVKTLIKLDKF